MNLRNRGRFNGFSCDDGYYLKGETQKVRFHKAWCLLWKLLKENLLDWWDCHRRDLHPFYVLGPVIDLVQFSNNIF